MYRAILLFLFLCPDPSIGAEPFWRKAENGGINSLYIMMLYHDSRATYEDLLRTGAEVGGGTSALSLKRLAKMHGLAMDVVSLPPYELYRTRPPFLVHIDGPTSEAGSFLVVVRVTRTHVHFINGPTASLQVISREAFERSWSGVALLVARRPWLFAGKAAAWLLAGCISACLWSYLKRKPLRAWLPTPAARGRIASACIGFCLLSMPPSDAVASQLESVQECLTPVPPEVLRNHENLANLLQNASLSFNLYEIKDNKGSEEVKLSAVYGVRLQQSRLYYSRSRVDAGSGLFEVSFDGEICYVGERLDAKSARGMPVLTKYNPWSVTDPMRLLCIANIPYFEWAGIYVPLQPREMKSYAGAIPLVSEWLKRAVLVNVHTDGDDYILTTIVADRNFDYVNSIDMSIERRRATQSGFTHTYAAEYLAGLKSAQTGTKYTRIVFRLAKQYGFFPSGREETDLTGRLLARYANSAWKEFAPGIWLPQETLSIVYNEKLDGPVVLSMHLAKLTYLISGDAEADYTLRPRRAGTLVNDRSVYEAIARSNHQVAYTSSADERTIRLWADVARKEMAQSEARWRPWAIPGALGLMLLAVLATRKAKS